MASERVQTLRGSRGESLLGGASRTFVVCVSVLVALFLFPRVGVAGVLAEVALAKEEVAEGALFEGVPVHGAGGATPGADAAPSPGAGPAPQCPPPAARGPAVTGPKFAVVDRVVDHNYAVLLVGSDEREWVVESADLPPGSDEGAWLRIIRDGGCDAPPVLALDHEKTREARASIAAKRALLRQRSNGPAGGD